MFLCPCEVFDGKKEKPRGEIVLRFHFMGEHGLHLTKGIV